MQQKILNFDTYSGALEAVIRLIKSRNVDLGVKHILLVPEKDTLKCEQMLFCGGGALDVEVYSLSRWFFKIGGGGVLPAAGAVMILKDILYDMELKCFFRSKNFDGFCSRLYDTICALESGCVDIDSLKADGALGFKLDDLKKIYTEFKIRTDGMYIDRVGKIRMLAQTLQSGSFLKSAHVYAANFGCLTKAEKQLFDIIGKKALSFTIAEVSGRPPITANIEIYKASSAVSALKAAAGRIRHLYKNGTAFADVCVVAPQSAFQQAKRIFGEYGLPYYVDCAQPLPGSRVAEYLRLLFDLKKLSRREFVLLSKNPLSGISPDDSDIFEDYCNSFLIDYLGFARPFKIADAAKNPQGEQKRLEVAERVRSILYKKVSGLWSRLEGMTDSRGFSAVIKNALDAAVEDFKQNAAHLFVSKTDKSKTGKKTDSVFFGGAGKNYLNTDEYLSKPAEGISGWVFCHDAQSLPMAELAIAAEKEKILSVLNTLDRFLCGNGRLDKKRLQFLISAFLEGISSEALEKLPRTQNCVIIGDAGIFKGNRFAYTFVIGFAEGVIPAPAASKGLITEKEYEILSGMGAELPTEAQLSRQNEYEILQLFAASQNLFLSYVHGGEQRPSPLLYEIIKESKKITYSGTETDRQLLQNGSNQELIKLAGSKSAGLELLVLTLNQPSRLTASLYKVLKTEADKYLFAASTQNEADKKIFLDNPYEEGQNPAKDSTGTASNKQLPQQESSVRVLSGQDLFFGDKTVSASQLQAYFSCPYKHFVEYGLRAVKKKSGRADSLDIGTAVHKVNQLFSRCGFDQGKLDDIIEDVLSGGIYDLKQNERLKTRLKNEIKSVCSAFGQHIRRGKFKRLGEEIRFGRGEKFVGCRIAEGTLKGSIDYADTYKGYIRIIDYKTGSASASLTQKDLYYGRRLQLPLYMLTMRENGFVPAAMLYFVFKSSWTEEGGCFSGVYLADKDILTAMDPFMQEENAVVPAKIKQTKSGEKISGTGAIDAGVMDIYLNYAGEVSALAVGQIAAGNIAPSPLKDDRYYTCNWCGFLPACGFKGQPRLMTAAEIVSKEAQNED